MDYILKLRISGWFEAYYQPEKILYRQSFDPDFKNKYLKGLIEDFELRGKCAISKFDSITGNQIEFDNDPNKVL